MPVCGAGKEISSDALVRKSHTLSWSVSQDDCVSGTLSSICSLSMVIIHARTHVHVCLRQQLKVTALAECYPVTFILHLSLTYTLTNTHTQCCVQHSG